MEKIFSYDIPIFWDEGKPEINYDSYTLEVMGEIENKITLKKEDIEGLCEDVISCRLTSVTRWSVRLNWGGILCKKFLDIVKPSDNARYVKFVSYGEKYFTVVPIEALKYERAIIATRAEGDRLPVEYGGPVRVVFPQLWGYKSAKSIVRIVFQGSYEQGYWEQRGYDDAAEIVASKIFDVNEKKTKFHGGGEVLW